MSRDIVKMIQEVMSDKEIQKVAGKLGFYKKRSKFIPAMFFDTLLYCASQSDACSLEQASNRVMDIYGIQISKQSIDERFNMHAIAFVKEILKRALEKQISQVFASGFLNTYNRICIKDSTRFNVPNRLSGYYKGFGGNIGSTNATVCIQYEYDARSGKILSLEITPGTRNDQTDAQETIAGVENGDLILRDLGYYSLPTLANIEKSAAFFISRLGSKTKIYETDSSDEVNFKKLYADMHERKATIMEISILAGKKEKMPLRMITSIIPEEVYKQRIRKIEKDNKEKGYKTSEDYKARCHFNLFITNILDVDLSLSEIFLVYKLRWQIEMMFKSWKSVFKIDQLQPMKYERFTCLLYAKLILIALNLQVLWNLQRHCYAQVKKILSTYKCFSTLQKSFDTLRLLYKQKRKIAEKIMLRTAKILLSNHWKEKHKNRTNHQDIIDLFVCKSNIYYYIQDMKKGVTQHCHP